MKREEVYAWVSPPEDPLPCNLPTTPTSNAKPRDAEIRSVVKALRHIRAIKTRGMKAENLKTWLVMEESEEKTRTEGEGGYKGRGNTQRRFVRLM